MKGTPGARNLGQLAAYLLAMGSISPCLSETVFEVPLMRAASHPSQQGFVLVTALGEAGEVEIHAWDDTGMYVPEPAVLTLEAGTTVAFNSDVLEQGRKDKGPWPGIGTGTGDWHLQLKGDIDFKVGAYMRDEPGFVTSMGSVLLPYRAGLLEYKAKLLELDPDACVYEANIFNPASNNDQQSWLRLINYDIVAATVNVYGIDADANARGPVSFEIPSGEVRSVTSQQLENGGDGLTGRLDDGEGKWHLIITSESPLTVMNLLETPVGLLTNLGPATTPGFSDAAVPVEEIGCGSAPPFIISRDR